MSTVQQPRLLTAEEFSRLPNPPDGSEQELVRGVIITMPPPKGRHGVVCSRVNRLIANFAEEKKLGIVTSNDTGVILERDPDTVRGPDIAFWNKDRQPEVPEVYFELPPDLAVEVLSPDTNRRKLREKIKEYLFAGTKLVWVVDPEERSVTICRGPDEGKVLFEAALLDGDEVLPGFRCEVAELFG
jgi:Uma2 family endonuclease